MDWSDTSCVVCDYDLSPSDAHICIGCLSYVCNDCAVDVSYDKPVLRQPRTPNPTYGARYIEFLGFERYLCPNCVLGAKTDGHPR